MSTNTFRRMHFVEDVMVIVLKNLKLVSCWWLTVTFYWKTNLFYQSTILVDKVNYFISILQIIINI